MGNLQKELEIVYKKFRNALTKRDTNTWLSLIQIQPTFEEPTESTWNDLYEYFLQNTGDLKETTCMKVELSGNWAGYWHFTHGEPSFVILLIFHKSKQGWKFFNIKKIAKLESSNKKELLINAKKEVEINQNVLGSSVNLITESELINPAPLKKTITTDNNKLQKELEVQYNTVRNALKRQNVKDFTSLILVDKEMAEKQTAAKEQLKEFLKYFFSFFPDLENTECIKVETLKNDNDEWSGYWMVSSSPKSTQKTIYFYPFYKTKKGWRLFAQVQAVGFDGGEEKIEKELEDNPNLSLKTKVSLLKESDMVSPNMVKELQEFGEKEVESIKSTSKLRKELEAVYAKFRNALAKENIRIFFSLIQLDRKNVEKEGAPTTEQLKEFFRDLISSFPELKNTQFIKTETLKNNSGEWAGYWILANDLAGPDTNSNIICFYVFHRVAKEWKLVFEKEKNSIDIGDAKIEGELERALELSLKERISLFEKMDLVSPTAIKKLSHLK